MLTLHSTPEEILAAFKTYGPVAVLKESPDVLRQQKKVMQLAVRIDGLALALASPELRKDKELVIDATKQSFGWAVFYASSKLKRNKDIQRLVWDINPWAYHHFLSTYSHRYHGIPEMQDHIIPFAKEQELSRLLEDPLALLAAPFYIRDNKNIVLSLVSKNGLALEFASERLQNHPKVVKTAVRQNGKALDFASKRLQNSSEMLQLAAWNSGIDGWFYYGSKFAFLALSKNNTDEATVAIDLSVYEALEGLSDEIRSRKYTLNKGLIAVNDNIQQTNTTQNEIGESLLHTAATIKALGNENEILREQLAATGSKLDATAALLQEKDDALAHLVNSLRIVETALAQKERQLDEAITGLHQTKTRFDEQLERLDNAQTTIETLTFEKERALSLAEQTQNKNNELKEQSLQDKRTISQSNFSSAELNRNLGLLTQENVKLKEEASELRLEHNHLMEEAAQAREEISKLRKSEQQYLDKMKSLETSRALLLQKLKENQSLAVEDNEEKKVTSRRESSSRFFI